MKISEITFDKEKYSVDYVNMSTQRLLDNKNCSPYELNLILSYNGFANEKAICIDIRCCDCPFYDEDHNFNKCSAKSSEYVRQLITKRRTPIEDMI